MATTTPEKTARPQGALDRYFQITERGSTISREIRGGLVTFLAMCYILALNPLILGGPDGTGALLGGDNSTQRIAAATALAAGVLTILMGVVARFPLAIATGLGLNALVAFGIAALPQMTWADAMGLVVLEGIIILILVFTGFREAVFKAVPKELKTAISVGIGLFIALIGLVDAGFVTPGNPVLQLGLGGSLAGWPILVFVLCLIAMAVLWFKQVKGAILYSIIGATVLAVVIELVAKVGPKGEENATGWSSTVPALPENVVSVPDFALLGQFSLFGSIEKIGIVAVILLVFSLMLADFFDTMGTAIALGAEGGFLDAEGRLPGMRNVLLVDSIAAAVGGAASASSATTYVESASGIAEGGRTGLTSVVTGLLFLVSLFFSPLAGVIPPEATAPALILVGFLMISVVRDISWADISVALPAFLTMVVMPFTYSITDGIGWGFISYTVIKVLLGRAREVHWLLALSSVLFFLYFALDPLRRLLGV